MDEASIDEVDSLEARGFQRVSLVGRGSQGEVIKAVRLSDGSEVAVKSLKRESLMVGDAHNQDLSRLVREFRLMREMHDRAASGSIEGLAEPLELFATPTHFHLVSRFVGSTNLREFIARRTQSSGKALSFEETATIMLPVLSALAKCHGNTINGVRQPIVHRDVKPDNIRVEVYGASPERARRSALVDFGVARVVGDGQTEGLTATGTAIGTPGFMAPEHMRASPSEASDQYSAGCVLYCCVCGRGPFAGGGARTLIDMYQAASQEAIDWTFFEDASGGEFRAIIQRCLRANPADRFASVEELARALSRFAPAPIAPSEPDEPAAARLEPPRIIPPPSRALPVTQPMSFVAEGVARSLPPPRITGDLAHALPTQVGARVRAPASTSRDAAAVVPPATSAETPGARGWRLLPIGLTVVAIAMVVGLALRWIGGDRAVTVQPVPATDAHAPVDPVVEPEEPNPIIPVAENGIPAPTITEAAPVPPPPRPPRRRSQVPARPLRPIPSGSTRGVGGSADSPAATENQTP